ncbi:protein FAR1-RELATED SEQUENCE 5-like [Zingiber officinale]|uniref:protein FAR1-RELATED SEQUENCE 5-like n=1 Tax=Zingiber officinale TaxID=94328 RepID=UPI001C4C26E2|nr:protein FAR1-RELATED SEQUENCE 5-like [Zingiber officinale]XP_042457792.1 protein FAR1-RELATED SEQUENCE 5-like [Zingiber officinale]XP_042457793.1 protein FAR1-RELATED SEQUENCE 5-like [Zingiber officinale]
MEASNSTSDSESVETIKAAISEKDEDEGRIDKIQGCASGEDVVGKDSQITKEGQAGHNKRHNNIGDTSFIPQTNINSQMEPEVGMVFHSEDQAYHFYNIYAQRKGFSVRKGHLGRRKDGTVRNRVFLCSNEGARQKHSTHITKKAREVVRTNCMARIEFKVSRDGIWVVSKIIYEHNHPLVRPHKTHLLRSHRRLLAAQHDETGEQLEKPAQTLEFLIEDDHDAESIGFVLKDQSSYLHTNRIRELERGDVQFLLESLKAKKLEDPSFFYAIQIDDREQVTNLFWADSRSIIDYTYFGDVVLFDTTYRANKNEMPFAPFIGINHHKQTVLFGAAVLLDETTESFVWLFRTLMVAMSGLQPPTIFTDDCPALSRAIHMTLPETCHRLCLWHILQNSTVYVSHVSNNDTNFQQDFKDCIHEEGSEDEFCSKWVRLIHKYDLAGNTWLEDLYAARERWALVYHKNSFYAFMMTMQWSDNMKKHFKNHFNRKLPLQKFLEQYHKSLYRFREKELYEDYKSRQTKPVLLVDMPMLNEAAESYTRLLYNDFEEEFKSQLSCLCEPIGMDGIVYTFKVTLPEKHSFGIVELKPSDLSVSCSCRKFECRGILCMHALKVLNINNILHLPTQYILKRWSKYANVEILSEKHQVLTKSDSQDLLTMHYTRVCHKAITIAVKSAFSEDALQIFDQELDKLTTEVEHVLHMDLLNRQTEDNATIIENIQQDAFGGKKIRGRKKRVKDGQDTKYKKHQSHSESVNTGSFYQTLHTKDKARQTNDPSDHLMINETSHVPSYHPDSTTSYGNTMPLQPSGSPFPQETIMPTQEPFTPSQGLFDHQMASQGASSANITWCRRGSIGIPMQVMQGQSNNYMNWVIPHRNISNLNVPPIHLDPMQPTIPVQHHQNLSHKLTFDINKGTADTTGHMQH